MVKQLFNQRGYWNLNPKNIVKMKSYIWAFDRQLTNWWTHGRSSVKLPGNPVTLSLAYDIEQSLFLRWRPVVYTVAIWLRYNHYWSSNLLPDEFSPR